MNPDVLSQLRKGRAVERLQKLFWIYFWLLILEGVLRKWVLPDLSTPLLIVRDPIVIYMYWIAYRNRLIPYNFFVKSLSGIAIVFYVFALLTAIQSNSSNFFVITYGMRANFLHFPIIFIVPLILSRKEFIKMGQMLLIISLPMAVLMAVQFLSPPTAFINRGAGGVIDAQLPSALGRIRPPGTFSFINGPSNFYPIITAFLIDGLLDRKKYSTVLLILGFSGCMLACIVSGSRGLIINVAIVVIASFSLFLPQYLSKENLLRIFLPVFLSGFVISSLEIFRRGVAVISARIENASRRTDDVTGGILTRVVNGFTGPFLASDVPFFGHGLGLGTNAGAALASGVAKDRIAEGEWGRIIQESGHLLGTIFIAWRIFLSAWLGFFSATVSIRYRSPLPFLLYSACAFSLTIGQLSSPTSQGLMTLGATLCYSSILFTIKTGSLPRHDS